MPERFGLEYTNAQNEAQAPIMLHRAIFGSLERFVGLLIEQYAGDFPLWLAPTQLRLLPISAAASASAEEAAAGEDFCRRVVEAAEAMGLRAEVDASGDRLNKMVRKAELERVPAVAVVGEQEMESGVLRLRGRRGVQLGAGDTDTVLRAMRRAAESRALNLDGVAADLEASSVPESD